MKLPDFNLEYVRLSLSTKEEAGLVIWLEAFQSALDNWDLPQCVRFLQMAKAVVQTEKSFEAIKYAEGQLADQQGDRPRAIACYKKSLTSARRANNATGIAQILSDLGLVYQAVGQWQQAVDCYQEALLTYRTLDDRDAVADLLGFLSTVYTNQGNFTDAQAHLDEALTLVTDSQSWAALLANYGLWWQSQGRRDEARQYYLVAIEFYRSNDDTANEATLLNNLGLLLAETGDFDQAKTVYTQVLTLTQAQNNVPLMSTTLGNLALLRELTGNFAAATSLYIEALANLEILRDLAGVARTHISLGRVHAEQDCWITAAENYRRALRLMEGLDDRSGQATALDGLGLAHRHQGELAQALLLHQQALGLAQQSKDRRQMAASQGNIGHVLLAEGKTAEAVKFYEQALESATNCEELGLESSTLLDLCISYFDLSDFEKLPSLIQRARLLATKLHQSDVLAKLSWLEGDLAYLEGENEATFNLYRHACAWALRYSENLLWATIERIEIYLETFLQADQPDQAIAFCQHLQQKTADVETILWQGVASYFNDLEIALLEEGMTVDCFTGSKNGS